MVEESQNLKQEGSQNLKDKQKVQIIRHLNRNAIKDIIISILVITLIGLLIEFQELSRNNQQLRELSTRSQGESTRSRTHGESMRSRTHGESTSSQPRQLFEYYEKVRIPPAEININQLVGMGMARYKSRSMKLVSVQKKNSNLDHQVCAMFNAITLVKNQTVATMINFLEAGASKAILIVEAHEILLSTFLMNQLKLYESKQVEVTVDSNYQFVMGQLSGCQKVVYLQNNFKVSQQKAEFLLSILKSSGRFTMTYTSRAEIIGQSATAIKQLKNLNSTDLKDQISPAQINEYIYGFDIDFLKILTPLNFAYFNKYTVEEMLIYPILAMLQGSSQLFPINQVVHSYDKSYVQAIEFQLLRVDKVEDNSLCFLSFPNDPGQASTDQLQEYLAKLRNPTQKQDLYLVVFAPYNSPNSVQHHHSLWQIGKQLLLFREFEHLRLRIRSAKSVVSLGLYESAHTYCPEHSTIISSRQNIEFSSSALDTIQDHLSEKYHFYLFSFRNEVGQQISIASESVSLRNVRERFETNSWHLQVISTDAVRMLYLWLLKCDEIDFYETEASYLIPIIEMLGNKISIIGQQDVLYQVKQRKPSSKQLQQINSLKQYFIWNEVKAVLPLVYNSLNNLSLRRAAKDLIPKIIHQVQIIDNPMTDFREALMRSIKDTNPDYQYHLWKSQNITISNFPLVYSTVMRTFEYQQESNRSYLAIASDLLKYEVLHRHGGIYLDLNIQSRRNLNPFLKYEIFFMSPDSTESFGQGIKYFDTAVVGATRENYYFNTILVNLVSEQNINFSEQFLPKVSGSFVVRRAFNDEETAVVASFGMQLFSRTTQQCFTEEGNLNRSLPCSSHDQSFLVQFSKADGT